MKLAIAIALTLLAAPATSFACSFDTDCDVGSKCKKESGKLYGYCAKGSNPGNDNDKKPYRDPIGRDTGNTCSFDTDCDPGSKCEKESGRLYGACMKKR